MSRIAERQRAAGFSRRTMLALAAGCAGGALRSPASAQAETENAIVTLVERLTGKTPAPSDRVRLTMPRVFPNGYTVPLALEVDSPMTANDHVTAVRVLAPRNPVVEVATFRFMPGRSRPRVSTRIRLAEPQFVVALAELNGGALLMSKAWVEVATNGCR